MGPMKTSYLWSYFSEFDKGLKIAHCDLCGQQLNYKTTISNLRKHLERRHPTVKLDDMKLKRKKHDEDEYRPIVECEAQLEEFVTIITTTETPQSDSPLKVSTNESPSDVNLIQHTDRKMTEVQKKRIDKLLLQLFIDDCQPFKIVEDKAFVNLVEGLNPSYKLPSRKTITHCVIPAEYEKCLSAVFQELTAVKSVCLTTDCWSSIKMESYLAVTAHYITDNFELRSILLECSLLPESHTVLNLAEAIKHIIVKFHLTDKVLAIVSDNSANITGAAAELKISHFGCFAHSLNLICQQALEVAGDLLKKVKAVVRHFKTSSTSLEQFFNAQKSMGLEPKKMVQAVSTRWNSTFEMLQRFFEFKDAIMTTVAYIVNEEYLPVFTEEDWVTCEELISVLEPFDEVTKEINGEQYLAGSQVIPLTSGLKTVCETMKKEALGDVAKQVVEKLLSGLNDRMANVDHSKSLEIATFLDPRFKLVPFTDQPCAQSVKETCQELIGGIWTQKHSEPNNKNVKDVDNNQSDNCDSPVQKKPKRYSVWENLESQISSKKVSGTKASASIIETNSYLEHDFVGRHKDPLLWWKENACYFPLMAELVKIKFNMVASSVPCDRIFSKAGNLIAERCCRSKPSDIEKLSFLNANSFLLN